MPKGQSHNPYFNRWFSAMVAVGGDKKNLEWVTILILIDGFLQFREKIRKRFENIVTILILIDGFLQ